jgi:ATP-dependent DNA helicase RecG
MDIKKLKNLVLQGESEALEFKKTTGTLQAIFETVCAFLNGSGGTILIGVSDNGKITGQDVTDKTRQEIANYISRLEPAAQAYLHIDYVPVEEEGRSVVAISVTAGKYGPYVYDGRPFLRNQSTTSRMTQHCYEQLIVKRGQLNHNWDELPAVGYKINSLDKNAIQQTVQNGVAENRIPTAIQKFSIEKILRYLELLNDAQVTNAAVVLYAKRMDTLYSHCEIKMTRYRGNDKLSTFMDSKHFIGNAFQILSEANYFIMRHLPVASFFEPGNWQRIDKPALPVMALREALINSITHRDYTNRSASISVSIFNDRVEIWNNGELLPPLTIKDLKKSHESLPRNKKIASIFRVCGFVEKAGLGTLRMVEECKKLGVPGPKFEQYSGGLAVIFKFAEPIGIEIKKNKTITNIKLTVRQKEILGIIKKHEIANVQQIKLGMEHPLAQRTIQKELNNLKNIGVVNYKGKGRAVVWFAL